MSVLFLHAACWVQCCCFCCGCVVVVFVFCVFCVFLGGCCGWLCFVLVMLRFCRVFIWVCFCYGCVWVMGIVVGVWVGFVVWSVICRIPWVYSAFVGLVCGFSLNVFVNGFVDIPWWIVCVLVGPMVFVSVSVRGCGVVPYRSSGCGCGLFVWMVSVSFWWVIWMLSGLWPAMASWMVYVLSWCLWMLYGG